MKLAIIGQQDFGKAVLEAFLARGDEVAGVFCAPEKPGARPDVLKVAAQEKGVKVFQFPSLQDARGAGGAEGARRRDRHHGLRAAVRAAGFRERSRSTARSSTTRRCCRNTAARVRSTGRSSRGDTKTGLTIFRPTDGLDEGPVILQKETADRPRRHARHGLFRPPVPDGRAGDAGGRRPRRGRQAPRSRCRTSRRPPTRAGSARPRRRSTGRTTSTSSTT